MIHLEFAELGFSNTFECRYCTMLQKTLLSNATFLLLATTWYFTAHRTGLITARRVCIWPWPVSKWLGQSFLPRKLASVLALRPRTHLVN